MKIAVICWAGRNNAGDERMFWCIKKYFKKHTIIPFETWTPAENQINQINSCNFVLIGGGTLIRRKFNDRYQFLKKIKPPIGCIGITVEAKKIHPDMQLAVDLLIEKSKFIYVRDNHSKKILYNHPKVIVGPDITFLYPFPISKTNPTAGIALNILDWHWWDAELYSPKYNFFQYLESKYPNFKKYYPGKKWDLDKFIDTLKSKHQNIEPFALYFDKDFIDGSDLASKYFQKKISKFSINPIQKNRLLISMRYHGLLFACQIGIPFVSLSYEQKNTNFCRDIGLPQLYLKLNQYQKIEQKINYINKNYDDIRNKLLSYRQIAKQQAEKIFATIEKQINQANTTSTSESQSSTDLPTTSN